MKKWQFFVPYGCLIERAPLGLDKAFMAVFPPSGWFFPDGNHDRHFIIKHKYMTEYEYGVMIGGVYKIRKRAK